MGFQDLQAEYFHPEEGRVVIDGTLPPQQVASGVVISPEAIEATKTFVAVAVPLAVGFTLLVSTGTAIAASVTTTASAAASTASLGGAGGSLQRTPLSNIK